jgi:limonene 1,2-monooxygenase
LPHFSGDNRPRIESFNWCTENQDLMTEKRSTAARLMFDKHEAEQKARKKGKTRVARPKKGKEASF